MKENANRKLINYQINELLKFLREINKRYSFTYRKLIPWNMKNQNSKREEIEEIDQQQDERNVIL